jgi:predicted dehydrogenase
VAICDTDVQKLHAFGNKFGVAARYDDVHRMLSEQQPDVVHVLSPPRTHAAISIAAMRAGCNVLVEKPMATSVDEADEMLAVAEKENVRLCANHNQLYEPVMLKAVSLLEQGCVGHIISVETHYSVNFVPDSSRPWVDELPGGVLQNFAAHPFYLTFEFVGNPVQMHVEHSSSGVLSTDAVEELRILVKGERSIGYIVVSLGIRPNVNCVRIFGTRATLHIDFAGRTIRLERLRSLPTFVARGLLNIEVAGRLIWDTISNACRFLLGALTPYQGHGKLIDAFYRSVETDSPSPISGESARRVIEAYDRIRAGMFAAQ